VISNSPSSFNIGSVEIDVKFPYITSAMFAKMGLATHGIKTKGKDAWDDAIESPLLARDFVQVQHLAQDAKEDSILIPSNRRLLDDDARDALGKLLFVNAGMFQRANPSSKGKGKGKRDKFAGRDGTTWNLIAQTWPRTKIPRIDNKPYLVCQMIEVGTIATVSTTNPVFGAVNFSVSQLDQITTLQNLFDQYRVKRLEAWITVAGQSGSASGTTAKWASVIDYDDSTVLSTYAAALDYQNCVETMYADAHYRTYVPHVAVATYSGAFTSFANEVAPWIDAASSAVQHYGLKFAFQQNASSNNSVYLTWRAHVEFRNVR
jgi:hypothetical protein